MSARPSQRMCTVALSESEVSTVTGRISIKMAIAHTSSASANVRTTFIATSCQGSTMIDSMRLEWV